MWTIERLFPKRVPAPPAPISRPTTSLLRMHSKFGKDLGSLNWPSESLLCLGQVYIGHHRVRPHRCVVREPSVCGTQLTLSFGRLSLMQENISQEAEAGNCDIASLELCRCENLSNGSFRSGVVPSLAVDCRQTKLTQFEILLPDRKMPVFKVHHRLEALRSCLEVVVQQFDVSKLETLISEPDSGWISAARVDRYSLEEHCFRIAKFPLENQNESQHVHVTGAQRFISAGPSFDSIQRQPKVLLSFAIFPVVFE